MVQRAESFNVANLMPLVADNPLTPAGLLAPKMCIRDRFLRQIKRAGLDIRAIC